MMTEWLRWQDGRQGGGYKKLLLIMSRRLKCDVYLLRYRKGAKVDVHRDPVKEGRHYRLNIVLKPAERGGVFFCQKPLYRSRGKRVCLFRPDVSRHMVTEVRAGTRYVLSIGWIRGSNDET